MVATQLAEQALGFYDLPREATVQLISISENEIYRVDSPSGQRWALRVQRPGYQSKRLLASEMEWLSALRRDGVLTTQIPVAGVNGEWVQVVDDPDSGKARNVVLFGWEDGSHPRMDMDLRHCFRRLGTIAAQMHAHGKTWQRPDGFERLRWDFETSLGETPRWGRWQDALGMNAGWRDLLSRTVELIRLRLGSYGDGPDRFGLAHCDLRLDNLLIDGAEIKVIDFDDCGFSWYMYDAAATVSFYEHLPQVASLIECWLEGYRTVISVSPAEEEEIPTFLMLRRLLLAAWIGSHQGTVLARSLGVPYTEQTVALCSAYLRRFS